MTCLFDYHPLLRSRVILISNKGSSSVTKRIDSESIAKEWDRISLGLHIACMFLTGGIYLVQYGLCMGTTSSLERRQATAATL